MKPDLKRLDQGTELAFQRICDSGEAPEPLRERMDEEAREKCTEAELRIAEKVYEFTDGRGYRNRTDRERLLAALRSRDEKALFGCRRCELAQIDEELVQEIAECYGALRSNQSRVAYADLILRILSTAGAEEYGKESRECLKKLGKMLKTLLTEQKDRPLECMAIRYFLEGTERL